MAVEETEPDAPLADCTAFQIDILLAISRGGPQKGLAIKDRLETRHGEVNHGRLYPNLDDLVDAGLLSKSQRDLRTNEYALTDRGQATLDLYVRYVRACVDGGAQ